MPNPLVHWTTIARDVASRLQGLDKSKRVLRLREEADKLGLEAHTLRRYLVLRAFLDRLGIGEEDARTLPIGPLEVVLRIWNRDPSIAAQALRMVRAGHLTFRKALLVERKLRSEQKSTQEVDEASWDQPATNQARVARAMQVHTDQCEEQSQLDDPRFDLVQAQAVYLVDGKTVAFLDEAASIGIGLRMTVRFAREALIAASIYDVVVVAFAYRASRSAFEACLRIVKASASQSIIRLEGDQEPFGLVDPSAPLF